MAEDDQPIPQPSLRAVPQVIQQTANLIVGFYEEGYDDQRDFKEQEPGCWAGAVIPTWLRWKSGVTAWWVRQNGLSFGHVELMFSDESVASSTEKTGIHFDHDRLLSNSRYTHFLKVQVSTVDQAMMQQFVRERVGRPFNSSGRTWNNISFLRDCMGPVDTGDRSYYCSELVTTLLKMGGKCGPLDPKCTDPTTLYTYLLRSGEGKLGYNEKLTRAKHPNGNEDREPGARLRALWAT